MAIDSIINCYCMMLMIGTSRPIYDKYCIKWEKKCITAKCLVYYSCKCYKIKLDGNKNNINQIGIENQHQLQHETVPDHTRTPTVSPSRTTNNSSTTNNNNDSTQNQEIEEEAKQEEIDVGNVQMEMNQNDDDNTVVDTLSNIYKA